jgi:hypothetical protein
MKVLKQLWYITGILILFCACKKEKSLEQGKGSGTSEWEFNDSTLTFNGRMDTAYRVSTGSIASVLLEGTSTDGSGDFKLEIFSSNLVNGTYKNPFVKFSYLVNSSVVYENVTTDTDMFSVTITSIDADGISGTFSGEVIDALGNLKQITGGTFNARFGAAQPPPTGSTGEVILWSKQGCGGAGNINVKLQNQAGSITAFQNTEPACGAAGTASFTVAPGAYAWEAYCNTDTLRGTVTVTSGSCTKVEIIFGVASTNCVISNLGYYDLASNVAIGSLTHFFNSSNQVNRVLFVDSATNNAVYTFTPVRNGNRVDIDSKQYFELDANGRIKEFRGFVDATDTSLPRVIITYTFNAGGYLTKAAYSFELDPSINLLNINYTWTGGNLSKAVVQQVGTTERVEYDFQYDLSKTANNFLCFFPNTEIFWVQSAINFGNNSANIIKSSTINYIDPAGSVTTENASYNYTFDANNYVKQFSILGDGSVLPGDTRYEVSYKCF